MTESNLKCCVPKINLAKHKIRIAVMIKVGRSINILILTDGSSRLERAIAIIKINRAALCGLLIAVNDRVQDISAVEIPVHGTIYATPVHRYRRRCAKRAITLSMKELQAARRWALAISGLQQENIRFPVAIKISSTRESGEFSSLLN